MSSEHFCCQSEQTENRLHERHERAAFDRERLVQSLAMENAGSLVGERTMAVMDAAGVGASALCMIHCLAMPLVIALLPTFAAEMFESPAFHSVLAFAVLGFCLLAYIPGFLKHGDRRLLWLGATGVGLVFYATFVGRFVWGESAEIMLITVGNLTLVAGHLLNRRLSSL